MRRLLTAATAASVLTACAASSAAGSTAPTVYTVAKDGHATHPVWYHDTAAVRIGSRLVLAWNSNHGSAEARTWNLSRSRWSTAAVTVSLSKLDCGCTDSTGSNPNRHDVPAVFADPSGRVYTIYGGGTASHTGDKTGPYFRAATSTGVPRAWGPEQRLSIPGAMYDVEVARDSLGVNHAIGQQGDNSKGAGSLLYIRVPPGTSTSPASPQPALTLVRGGYDPSACSWLPAPGCDIYVIGRLAIGPTDPAHPNSPAPLYLTWGWTERNLSGTCGDPAGFCDHGLYFAKSLDGGTHWQNASATASVDITSASIGYADPRFEVMAPTTNVGLYKAITVTGDYPGTPWIAYQPNADTGTGTIEVTSWSGSAWAAATVVDSSRAWNNHLVFRGYSDGRLALWSDIAQSGTHASQIAQWTLAAGASSWVSSRLSVGANWFLTGRSAGGSEVLMWRAPGTTSASVVRFTLLPEPM